MMILQQGPRQRVWHLLGALSLAAMATLGGTLNVRIAHEKSFVVIGIAVRTNNARESTQKALIPRQWQRFFAEHLREKIPGMEGDTIYALYGEYQSDRSGDYTYVLGMRVKEGSTAPPGMVSWTVPAGRYAVFTTPRGSVTHVIGDTWRQIWDEEDQSRLHRAYKTDFEVYDERASPPPKTLKSTSASAPGSFIRVC